MSASSDAVVVRDVVLPADLHARPAGDVTRAVAQYDARVRLVVGDREADARSVLAVMGLGATAGQTVSVRGEGQGARSAVDAVVVVLSAAQALAH
jgi:phosphotransferase system HPr (HPr) family protein